MKNIRFSPAVKKELKEIQSRDIKLSKRIEKQLDLFTKNPRHKSLRLHKIKRKDNLKVWSISINEGYRMIYEENDVIYFVDIGTHDEVYRK